MPFRHGFEPHHLQIMRISLNYIKNLPSGDFLFTNVIDLRQIYIIYFSIYTLRTIMKKYLLISMLAIISLTGILCTTNAKTYTMPSKKYVALTFDDGPNENTTPLLLDILKAKNAHATFLLIGQNIQQCSDIVQRIYDE